MEQGAQLNGVHPEQIIVHVNFYLQHVNFCLLMMGINLQPLSVCEVGKLAYFQREGTMGVCHDILQNFTLNAPTLVVRSAGVRELARKQGGENQTCSTCQHMPVW